MKATDMAWIVPLGVVLVGAATYVVMLSGRISTLEQDLKELRPTLEQELREAVQVITQREQEALEAMTGLGLTQFGAWEERADDTDYLAETDGFIAAAAFRETLGFNILFWSEENQERRILTRANKHDGTVTPIPRGTWWRVEFHTRNGPVHGPIEVRWLPIVRQTP